MQIGFAEVRPVFLCHPEFRVTDLPQQEVADPHFASRANNKIRIHRAGCVKMAAYGLLVDGSRVEFTVFRFCLLYTSDAADE